MAQSHRPICGRWHGATRNEKRACARVRSICRSEIRRGRLTAIHCHVVFNLLAFSQSAHAGALHRRDVHENILAAIIGTDEAITFLGVEPFDGADSQERSPLKNTTQTDPREIRPGGWVRWFQSSPKATGFLWPHCG